jgi:hypothetical protein
MHLLLCPVSVPSIFFIFIFISIDKRFFRTFARSSRIFGEDSSIVKDQSSFLPALLAVNPAPLGLLPAIIITGPGETDPGRPVDIDPGSSLIYDVVIPIPFEFIFP